MQETVERGAPGKDDDGDVASKEQIGGEAALQETINDEARIESSAEECEVVVVAPIEALVEETAVVMPAGADVPEAQDDAAKAQDTVQEAKQY